MNCPRCNYPLQQGRRFCSDCGYDTLIPPATQQQYQNIVGQLGASFQNMVNQHRRNNAPAIPTSQPNNGRVSRVGIGFTVFGVVCLLIAGLIYAAISNKPQVNTYNGSSSISSGSSAPKVPLTDDIVKYQLSQYQFGDPAYAGLTIRSIDWVPSAFGDDTEFVCVRFYSNGVTTNLAEEYTFNRDSNGWGILANGDRTVNPCR